MPSIITSNYSSALTTNDAQFSRPQTTSSGYYYEAIQIIVDRSGTYDIKSLSNMDTRGYLYNGTFYPSSSLTNLIAEDDDSGGNSQFRLTPFLEAGVPYTLVVTTHSERVTGNFSVVATDPGNVQYIRLNIRSINFNKTISYSLRLFR
jgi:hypothetical protein